MFTKILVPLDGSKLAERALEPALALARQVEGKLILLRAPAADMVLLPDMAAGYAPAEAYDAPHDSAREYLLTQQQQWAYAGVPIHTRVAEGSVADVIVDTAAAEKADLIVMSSHGYSGITRWVLGSVAERVLHAAPCPVLVVRSPKLIRHVLIPLDGSALAERAVAPGLELAAGVQAEVTLLRAIPTVEAEVLERLEQVEQGLGQRLQSDLYDEADEYLARVAAAHRPAGLLLKTLVVTEHPAEAILDYVEYHGVDAVAMSTHGYTGLKRWTYGSVTEKVLRGARTCSVLVVRAA
jgi:nucleotide-binding universal stress UspA family protein